MARTIPRVLVLIKGLGIGGAEKLISEGARFWDRERFDYSVAYVLPWKDQLVAELGDLKVPVDMIGTDRGLTGQALVELRRLISRRGIDVVHAHLPTMGIVARLVSPVPVVYTEHNMADSYRPLTRWANRLTYGRNRGAMAVSEAVAGSVSTWRGPKMEVIPNGVSVRIDPEAAAAARRELEIDEDAPLVVHVGNIRPGKGHDTLIDAVRILREDHPDVTFVSIGGEKYPGDLERVRGLAATAGLGSSLRFIGRRPDALSFIAAADVYVNPSSVEGLPVAVLEALALARPVVATAAGGVPSIVKDGETGILVEPSEPRALAAGVTRMLSDSAMAQQLAASAKRMIESEYGLEPMVRATEKVYLQVLGV
ncbi:MAG: glycosyltransferase [Acidimicrobiia bacterium]